METAQVFDFLEKFVNQAIHKGGFTANDARNALNALDMLKQKVEVPGPSEPSEAE